MRLLKRMAGEMSGVMARLWPLIVVALFAEWGYAIMNVCVLPVYLKEPPPQGLGAPMSLIGLVISTFLVAETAFKPLFGWSGDRYGRKRFIVLGLIICSATPLLMRIVDKPWVFFPLRALDGVGAAALWPCLLASVAAMTSSKERMGAMSVFNMIYMLGIALALGTYSLVFQLTGHNIQIFLVISGVFMVAAVLSLFTIQNTKDPAHAHLGAGHTDGPAAVAEPLGWRESLELAVSSRVLLVMMVVSFLQATGTNILNGVIVVYIHEVLGVAESGLTKIMAGPGIAIVLLALPLGWLGGRWGKVKSVCTGLGIAGVSFFIIPHATTILSISIVIVPLVIGFLIASPAGLALITEIAPEGKEGLIVGAVATAQGMGAMIGPALGGWLYENVNPGAPFRAAGVFMTAAMIVAVFTFKEGMKVVLPNGE